MQTGGFETMNERWNLDPIYLGFDDPAFEADMAALKAEVDNITAFAAKLPGLPPMEGLGLALYNRMIRAAAHTVLKL